MFATHFEHIKTNKNNHRKKYEPKVSENRQIFVSKVEEYIDNEIAALPITKELSMIDKSDLLLSCDYTTLYPSLMAHNDFRCPKIETAKSINQNESNWFCSSFSNKTWESLKESGVFKVK